ncbi:MAG: hypothetical protein JWQ30_2126 [Sediminibacterium sp.]|nr:hypothetical protein [Sediminibacterium sp.]
MIHGESFEMENIMEIALYVLATVVSILIAGKVYLELRFRKQVKQLFIQSRSLPLRVFRKEQLAGLPEPVKRYFLHVLKEGQLYIRNIRLLHDGEFKTGLDKDWVPIKGEQYFTTDKPGFIWKGKTALFTARDMYLAGKGRLVVYLFNLFRIADGHGKKFDKGELLRWLAESVWFPTNLLPSGRLKWIAIDDSTAQLIYTYLGLTVDYIVSFNTIGEITRFETKRYMGDKDLETWVGTVSEYQKINEVTIPVSIEVRWDLKTGSFPYARFHVTHIEYGKPALF